MTRMRRRDFLRNSALGAAALGAKRPLTLLPGGAPITPEYAAVYVVLWFDTEDYILPQSDDAALRVAGTLTKLGVRATFKVVGEKARTLERRGRTDVIAALARHEIGYHSNTHSQHPTVAEYEAPLDWDRGAAEFTRREHPGFEDVRRIFGMTPTCYGQPGSSWAPQSFPALKSWGVNVYLDDARQVGLEGKPFWFGGLLNIFNLKAGANLRPSDDWSNLEEAKANFRAAYDELLAAGGGVVSLYFHPCEFIHREFWDAVNFAHGLNPPREQWRLPPMQGPAEIERNFGFLEGLVTHMKSFDRVRFATASEALAAMPDAARGREFTPAEVAAIAAAASAEVSFQANKDYALAAGEVMDLLSQFVAGVAAGRPAGAYRLRGTPYGPSRPAPPLAGAIETPWDQFARTVIDADAALADGQVPSPVWLGSTPAPPESYLMALAGVVAEWRRRSAPPASVRLVPARLAAAEYVADDAARLWDWIIFPPGFDAPGLMAVAKQQAWTLKPARLRGR